MYEPYLEVCRRSCELHPGAFAKKAMLVNSGAEAVENAVKIARYAPAATPSCASIRPSTAAR